MSAGDRRSADVMWFGGVTFRNDGRPSMKLRVPPFRVHRPRPATVMAGAALFLAAGGPAAAVDAARPARS